MILAEWNLASTSRWSRTQLLNHWRNRSSVLFTAWVKAILETPYKLVEVRPNSWTWWRAYEFLSSHSLWSTTVVLPVVAALLCLTVVKVFNQMFSQFVELLFGVDDFYDQKVMPLTNKMWKEQTKCLKSITRTQFRNGWVLLENLIFITYPTSVWIYHKMYVSRWLITWVVCIEP